MAEKNRLRMETGKVYGQEEGSMSVGRGRVKEMTGRFQKTVELSPEAIFWIEEDGQIYDVNPQACRSLGYTREEMLSLFLWDIDPYFHPRRWSAHLKNVRKDKKVLLETIHRHKNGRTFPVEVSATQVSFDDREFHVAFVRDITERKRAENTLKESESRFRILMERIPNIAIQGYTFDRKVIFWNHASEKLYGYTAEEAQGRDLLELIIPENLKDHVAQEIQHMGESGEPAPANELLLKRKGGTAVPVYTSHVLIEEATQPSVFYSFDIDLSNLKKAESERSKLQHELEQSQKLESIGRLAGGVAHDYNNMLGVIIGYTELAQMKLEGSGLLREEFTEILTAAKRSRDITQQLLAFARKQTLAPKTLNLNEAAEKTLKMLRQLLGENIELRWHPKEGLWPVKIDPSQIDQILTNLCINARDAIDDIGRITLKTDNVRLDQTFCDRHPGVRAPGDFVMLSLSDDGCGMDPETLESIFEPFFTTKGVGSGTGLGLAMVYGVIKQSNGFIDVSSEPGEGTTFKIYLPRYGEWPREEEKNVGDGVAEGQGETILVVEDEVAILRLTTKMLEDLGYNVLPATSPSEALRVAEVGSERIDLLITDVIRPEMNGRELADRLLSNYPQMKCFFMSGYTENAIVHHGVLDPGINFIQKPFSRKDFSVHIRDILNS